MKVLTGNRLRDGVVVFLQNDGTWRQDLDDARIFEKADETVGNELAAAAQRDRIAVSLELVDVTRTGEGLRLSRLRERIRLQGPTVAYGEAELAARRAPQRGAGA